MTPMVPKAIESFYLLVSFVRALRVIPVMSLKLLAVVVSSLLYLPPTTYHLPPTT